ncbi:bifunctional diguanylate cyclase/phosphodiesterase [Niallia taxi]|uniref:bifunctional diguanylate cyclase/phosphodiesterase n=1 Tax=Niallia taxi TaxID=2499688 RepID=UPI0015F561DA|nr:EAL domain-containing protein [Niallia taxi]
MDNPVSEDSLFDTYKSLFNYNSEACFALNMRGEFLLVNPAAEILTGYSDKEFFHLSYEDLIEKQDRKVTIKKLEGLLNGDKDSVEVSIRNKQGEKIDLSIVAVPIFRAKRPMGIVGVAKDVTQQNYMEFLVKEQNKILKMIVDGTNYTTILDEIVSIVEKVAKGSHCSVMIADKEQNKLYTASSPKLPSEFATFINGIPIGPKSGSCGTAAYFKQRIIVSDIAVDPLWEDYRDEALAHGLKACWSTPVFDSFNNVIGCFAIYHSKPNTPNPKYIKLIEEATYLTSLVIQRSMAEEKIQHLAYHDELTGLPNRRFFEEKLKAAIADFQPANNNQHLALLFMDLDRFKFINDTLGHHVGDILLKQFAERLNKCIQKRETVSRQGGDEFTVLLRNVTEEEVRKKAKKIIQILSSPFLIDGHEIFITPSIGIAMYPKDSENNVTLIRNADIAMYEAKKEGRNNYQFYNEKFDFQSSDLFLLETELRKADISKHFKLHFQPIVDLKTNAATSAEALIRWQHPELGLISPEKFIKIAEDTGLIIPIGEWVLREVCQELKARQERGLSPMNFSVNLSLRQFFDISFVSTVASILTEEGINPAYITLEITESMTMDVEKATQILYQLKDLGVEISIDDFGTGYSSLQYLQKFPIDYLKIDKSFIQNIGENMDDCSIASTIIVMAHNLGLKVIAEGVETEEQVSVLKGMNCEKAQGYYYSKPLPLNELHLIESDLGSWL